MFETRGVAALLALVAHGSRCAALPRSSPRGLGKWADPSAALILRSAPCPRLEGHVLLYPRSKTSMAGTSAAMTSIGGMLLLAHLERRLLAGRHSFLRHREH